MLCRPQGASGGETRKLRALDSWDYDLSLSVARLDFLDFAQIGISMSPGEECTALGALRAGCWQGRDDFLVGKG